MNIVEKFKNIFGISSCDISERNKVFEVSSVIKKNQVPTYESLIEFLRDLPNRDNWKISFSTIVDDQFEASNKDIYFSDGLQQFSNRLIDDEDIVTIRLSVEKEIVANTMSVYCFNKFSDHLLSKSILDIMKTFSFLLHGLEYLVFELFDTNILFSTSTIIFKSYNQNPITKNFLRAQRLNSCKDISYFYNSNEFELIPDDFRIDTDFLGNPFGLIFNKIETILSLTYIASISTIEVNTLKGQINGQRNLDFQYNLNDDIEPNKELYKIYDWIYTDGNAVDKAIIARNIISLHCRYTDLLMIDGKTYASIQSNFKLYLKDNVSQYLDLKNKLADFISTIVIQIGDNTNELLSNFKTNLIAIFGFLLSIILVNIVSEQPLDNIFTRDISIIMELVLFGSFGYLIICIIELRYKLKKIEEGYIALKKNYINVLDTIDIENIFDNDSILNCSKEEVKRGMTRYSIIWISFLSIAIIIIENISEYPIIWSFLKFIFR